MERVIIGRVVAPHGIRGDVRVLPLTDFPERFQSMKVIDLYSPNGEHRQFAIKKQISLPRGLIGLSLEGITTRDDAEVLRDWQAEVSPEDRVPLEKGQYWVADLIGLNAVSTDGDQLGTVKAVHHWGSNDTFEIIDDEGKEHYVPFVDQFIKSVDLEQGRLIVQLMEGLWD